MDCRQIPFFLSLTGNGCLLSSRADLATAGTAGAARLHLLPKDCGGPGLPAPRATLVDTGVRLACLWLMHVALHIGDHTLLGAEVVVGACLVRCGR